MIDFFFFFPSGALKSGNIFLGSEKKKDAQKIRDVLGASENKWNIFFNLKLIVLLWMKAFF